MRNLLPAWVLGFIRYVENERKFIFKGGNNERCCVKAL
jgi:hypothetical protein